MVSIEPLERRGKFLEKLSIMLIVFSSLGALLVLLDPIVTWDFGNGNSVKFGGEGFADQLKGGVVMLMIVGGFTGLVSFWFPGSATGQRQAETVSRIAEQSAPVAAAAAAAAVVPGDMKTDTMNVEAKGDVTVTEQPQKPKKGKK